MSTVLGALKSNQMPWTDIKKKNRDCLSSASEILSDMSSSTTSIRGVTRHPWNFVLIRTAQSWDPLPESTRTRPYSIVRILLTTWFRNSRSPWVLHEYSFVGDTIMILIYHMSKKYNCSILYGNLLYKKGHYFSDTQYIYISRHFWRFDVYNIYEY